MTATDFERILNKVGLIIMKQETNMKKAILIQETLVVTLRFLSPELWR